MNLPAPPEKWWRLTKFDADLHEATFKFGVYRTNERLYIYHQRNGMRADLVGAVVKDVTDQLPQHRWTEIYQRALATWTLLGRAPEHYIEEII